MPDAEPFSRAAGEECKRRMLPSPSIVIDGAPHQAWVRRVRAVVHHGGAGTTAAGLRAGLPTLVFPQVGDQTFWGRRIERLACGPSPVMRRDVGSKTLEQRVRDLVDRRSYRLQAQALASTIAQEYGVARAIDLIEAAAASRTPRSRKPTMRSPVPD